MKALHLILTASAVVAAAWFARPALDAAPSSAGGGTGAASGPLQPLAALPPPADTASGRARKAAQEKVQSTPGNHSLWTALGDAIAREFRDTADESLYAHAENIYLRALGLNPSDIQALCGMAWVTGGRHEFPQSIEWAQRALTMDAQCADALGILGDAQLALGDMDQAAETYQRMMDSRPDLSSWSRGAHLLWMTGDKAKALWLMEKSIRAGGPYAENTDWCRAQLATMLFHDGALVPALQTLEPALAAGSRNRQVLLAAARILAAQGKHDQAKQHLTRLLESGPQHDALVLLGDLHAVTGNSPEAERCYAEVEKLLEKHRSTHANGGSHGHLAMAKFYADHDRNLPEAMRLAEPSMETRNPAEADIVAWVCHKNGRQKEAIALMKRALKHGTPDPSIRYHAGMIAAAAGDKSAAQRRLQEALSMNPQFDLIQAPLAKEALESTGAVTATAQPGEDAH